MNERPTGVLHRILRSRLALVVQVLVTLALVAWIGVSLDADTWRALHRLDAAIFAVAALLFASAQIFGGLRLAVLLADTPLTWREAVATTWIGYFSANFLPGTFGGDIVRVVRLKGAGVGLGAAIGALAVDRVFNCAAIAVILALTAWPTLLLLAGSLHQGLIALGFVACAAAAALAALIVSRRPHARAITSSVFRPLSQLARSPGRLAVTAILSFVTPGVAIIAQWLVARDLGIAIGVPELAGIICFITLAVLLPVTVNGIGLQEGLFVVLLTKSGAPLEVSLAFALLSRALIIVASLVGGILFMHERILRLRPSPPSR